MFENHIINLVLLIIVIIIVYWYFKGRTESFVRDIPSPSQEEGKRDSALEYKQDNLDIQPPFVRTDVRTLMSGSGYVPQKEIYPAWGDYDNDGLMGKDGESYGFQYNLCSPACCSEQYPTPFKLPRDKFVCDNKQDFWPNSYTCGNQWENAGCLCMTKDQGKFLNSRGNNA